MVHLGYTLGMHLTGPTSYNCMYWEGYFQAMSSTQQGARQTTFHLKLEAESPNIVFPVLAHTRSLFTLRRPTNFTFGLKLRGIMITLGNLKEALGVNAQFCSKGKPFLKYQHSTWLSFKFRSYIKVQKTFAFFRCFFDKLHKGQLWHVTTPLHFRLELNAILYL